jgi:hypothetical protein
MLDYILCLLIGLVLGYVVRDVISRRRHKKFRSHRIRDRFATNETNENFVVTLKQAPGLAPKADFNATREDAGSR